MGLKLGRRIALSVVVVSAIVLATSGTQMDMTASAKSGYKIFFLPKRIDSKVFVENGRGGQEAAAALGDSLTYDGPSDSSATAQIKFINTAVDQHYNAIVISAVDFAADAPALENARRLGIKVVSYQGDVEPAARTIYVSPATSRSIGEAQIQWLGSQMHYRGQFAILSSTPASTNTNMWIQVMKQALRTPKYSNMTLVGVAYGNDDPATAEKQTQALLNAHPKLRGIVAPTNQGILSAAAVLTRQKKCKTVALTGLGEPDLMRPYVKGGCAPSFGLWNERNFGYLAVYVAHLVLTGQLTGKLGQTFEAGRLGRYKVQRSDGNAPVVVLGKPFEFTPKNIDQFHF
jgi:rhamnose transport system substrate-binding protein